MKTLLKKSKNNTKETLTIYGYETHQGYNTKKCKRGGEKCIPANDTCKPEGVCFD